MATSDSTLWKILTFTSELFSEIGVINGYDLDSILVVERETNDKGFPQRGLLHLNDIVGHCLDDLLTNSFKNLLASVEPNKTKKWCLENGLELQLFSFHMFACLFIMHFDEFDDLFKNNRVSFSPGNKCFESVVE